MRYIAILSASQQGITTLSFDQIINHIPDIQILSRGMVYLFSCPAEKIEQVRSTAYPYYIIIEDFDPPMEN